MVRKSKKCRNNSVSTYRYRLNKTKSLSKETESTLKTLKGKSKTSQKISTLSEKEKHSMSASTINEVTAGMGMTVNTPMKKMTDTKEDPEADHNSEKDPAEQQREMPMTEMNTETTKAGALAQHITAIEISALKHQPGLSDLTKDRTSTHTTSQDKA